MMKLSFVAFAAIMVSMSSFVDAAVCDNPTKVDRCDNKKCTFDVFHYPLDEDGIQRMLDAATMTLTEYIPMQVLKILTSALAFYMMILLNAMSSLITRKNV